MTFDAFSLPDLSATADIARRLAPHLRAGDMLALQGDLGAGKTAFARALIYAFGIGGEVPSPTFTLMQSYDAPGLAIHHFDLYRLKDEMELEELGWDDALADGLVIVEWPERAGGRLPRNRLTLHFSCNEKGERKLSFEPQGDWIEKFKNIK